MDPFERRSSLINNQKRASKRVQLLKASWAYQYKHFFENSTLHGVRYINEADRPFIERFMWFCFTTIGALVTLIIIVSLWDKFQTNPTITGLDTDFHNWNVIFPSIMFCPSSIRHNENIDNLVSEFEQNTNNKDKNSQRYREFLEKLSTLNLKNMALLVEYQKDEFIRDDQMLDTIHKLYNSCPEIFSECYFLKNQFNCCTHIHGIPTEIGYCYGFNSVFSYPTEEKDGPFQTKMILETDENWILKFDFLYNRSIFQIYAQTPNDLPVFDVNPQYEYYTGTVSGIYFDMKETYTTQEAHQLSITQRKCIFDDEIRLEINKVYTYSACLVDCRIKQTKALCGCVPIFYRITGKSSRYCTFKDFQCLSSNIDEIMVSNLCNCELGCMNTVFEVEKIQEIELPDYSDSFVLSNLEMGFNSWPMVRYKREVLFGWVDLLVAFGGIAGLFLGFSLLSGIEIIYFFTIRTLCMTIREQDVLENEIRESKSRPRPPLTLSLRPLKNVKKSKKETPPISPPNRIAPLQPSFNNKRTFNVISTGDTLVPLSVSA